MISGWSLDVSNSYSLLRMSGTPETTTSRAKHEYRDQALLLLTRHQRTGREPETGHQTRTEAPGTDTDGNAGIVERDRGRQAGVLEIPEWSHAHIRGTDCQIAAARNCDLRQGYSRSLPLTPNAPEKPALPAADYRNPAPIVL